MYKIFNRHWLLLTEDPVIAKYIDNRAGIT